MGNIGEPIDIESPSKHLSAQACPRNYCDSALETLYATSNIAKIWGVAARGLSGDEPPNALPEYTLPNDTVYIYTDISFWTSGFFPGSLYTLYERARKWPHKHASEVTVKQLKHACQWWTYNIHAQASQRGTHDLGFLIQPWAQLGWELDKDYGCYESLVKAAYGLAARFDGKVGCIRSWDTCVTSRYSFTDPSQAFLVIIDNMMNLDLLYLVASLEKDPALAEIATSHALTTMHSHIRFDSSTYHVVNFDQSTGHIKERLTNQGYSDESCWARGQAWGIVGFAQCYLRTKDVRFFETAERLAEYFLSRVPRSSVTRWDFDAPKASPPDTSAGLIAAYGMLLIFEADRSLVHFRDAATDMVETIIRECMTSQARFDLQSNGEFPRVDLGGHDAILEHSTINNYEFAPRRWADHGVVYADYYFLRIGNKLLELGIL